MRTTWKCCCYSHSNKLLQGYFRRHQRLRNLPTAWCKVEIGSWPAETIRDWPLKHQERTQKCNRCCKTKRPAADSAKSLWSEDANCKQRSLLEVLGAQRDDQTQVQRRRQRQRNTSPKDGKNHFGGKDGRRENHDQKQIRESKASVGSRTYC